MHFMNYLSPKRILKRLWAFSKRGAGIAGLSLLAACDTGAGAGDGSGENPLTDKLEQLKELRKEQTEIGNQIRKLEQEILAAGGTLDDRTPRPVEILTVQPTVFKTYLEVQGKLDAEQNVTVSADLMGTVVSVRVDEDQKVGKGAVLAQLDSRVLQQSVAEVKTQLDLATTLFNKQKSLWDQGIGSEVQYLSAKANKESLEQRLATMHEQLAMYTIRSPISGTVDEVNVKVGSTVAPGMPAFRVVNLNELVARAQVAESYGLKIKKGDEAIVEFPDLRKEVIGQVSFVARTIDPMSRSFTVEVAIKNDNQSYRPNMIAIVRTVASQCDSCLVVPVNAVQTGVEGKYVMVASAGGTKAIAERRLVTVGSVHKGQAQIVSGLRAGDQVIVKGYDGLSKGQPVTIQTNEEPVQ